MIENYYKKIRVLESCLGDCDYRYPQPEIAFYCPNCHHRKKKLMINIDKNYYKCWVCGKAFAGKSVIPLIKRYGDQNLLNEWLALTNERQLDVDLKSLIENSLTSDIIEPIPEIIKLPDECKNILEVKGSLNPFKNYLNARGITDKLIEKYQIKCCSEGRYKDRIIVPSFDVDAKINFFIARNIYREGIKYLNPSIRKSLIVFNELFISWENPVILVEGVFDALKVDYNCVPILGTALESSVIKDRIIEHETTVYLMLDNDAYEKQLDIIERFLSFGIKVYNVIIDKKDPGSMSRQEILENIKNAKLLDNKYELMKARLS